MRAPWVLAILLAGASAATAAERWSQGPAPAWVAPAAIPGEDTIPKDGVLPGLHYLLADHQVLVEQGTSAQYSHWAWKVLSAAGLEQASELRIRFNPSYQRLVIHHVHLTREGRSVGSWSPRDVKVIQDEENLDQRIYDESLTALVFLKDVRAGDVVDYAYTIFGQNPILEGRFVARLALAYAVPVSLVRHRVLWPRPRTLRYQGHRTTLEPRTETQGERTVYTWEARAVAALVEEDRLPRWHDPSPSVQLTEFASWAEVASWAARTFAPQARTSPAMARLVEGWRKLPSEEERARAAVRMVQDEIRYLGIETGPNSHRPHAPAQVLDQRFGDCKDKALLLSALLDGLGVAATPALVDTDTRRQLDEWLPTPYAFDHVIVRARVDGKDLWIDGTQAEQGGPLTASAAPPFERALLVREGETGLVPLPPTRQEHPTTLIEETYVAPAAASSARLTVRTTYTGADADHIRSRLQSESADDRARAFLNFYARTNPGLRVLAPPKVDDRRSSNVVTIDEQYELPQFWDDGGRWFRAWPVTERLDKPGTTVRSQPLGIDHPVSLRYRLRVDGLSAPPDPPRMAMVSDDAFRFTRSAARNGGSLVLTYDLQTLSDSVPLDAVARHLAHVDDVYRDAGYYIAAAGPLFRTDAGGGDTGSWLGLFAGLGGLALGLGVGLPWLRSVRRRRAFARRQQYASGATAETALRAPSAAAARQILGTVACTCGAAVAAEGQWSSFRFDGRVMTVVARECAACRETQNLYFDVAPAPKPD